MTRITIDPRTLRTYQAEGRQARAARHAAAEALAEAGRRRAARQAPQAPQGFILATPEALARTLAPRPAAPYSARGGERTCIGRPQAAPSAIQVQARPRPQARQARPQAAPRRPQVQVQAAPARLTLGAALRLALAPLALILALYGAIARGGLRLIGWGRLAR